MEAPTFAAGALVGLYLWPGLPIAGRGRDGGTAGRSRLDVDLLGDGGAAVGAAGGAFFVAAERDLDGVLALLRVCLQMLAGRGKRKNQEAGSRRVSWET